LDQANDGKGALNRMTRLNPYSHVGKHAEEVAAFKVEVRRLQDRVNLMHRRNVAIKVTNQGLSNEDRKLRERLMEVDHG